MDELISKQAAIDLWEKYHYTIAVDAIRYDAELRQLPSAQPEQHWIPVTEDCECDLMDNEEVLVFQKDGTINGQIRHAMFYDFNGKKKFVTWEEGITIYHVLAYRPLPEPYKMEG